MSGGGQYIIDPETGKRVRKGKPPQELSRAERRALAEGEAAASTSKAAKPAEATRATEPEKPKADPPRQVRQPLTPGPKSGGTTAKSKE